VNVIRHSLFNILWIIFVFFGMVNLSNRGRYKHSSPMNNHYIMIYFLLLVLFMHVFCGCCLEERYPNYSKFKFIAILTVCSVMCNKMWAALLYNWPRIFLTFKSILSALLLSQWKYKLYISTYELEGGSKMTF